MQCDIDKEDDHRPCRRLPRMPHRVRASAGVVLAATMFLAACGGDSSGPGVAGDGGSSVPAKTVAPGGGKARALAYSKCMRAHGVADFPDPNTSGEIELDANGTGAAPDSPAFQKAAQACKVLQQTLAGSPAQQRKNFAQALEFAKCMRTHGVKFPDPPPPGSAPQTQSHSGANNAGPDPSSPQFQKAQTACRSLAPGGDVGTGQSNDDGS